MKKFVWCLPALLYLITSRIQAQNGEAIIRIPVVVHVVWYSGAPAENISDAQIISQIDVLNKDFQRKNLDAGLVPEQFQSLIGTANFEFCLASRTPEDCPTNGITRRESSVTVWPPFTDLVKSTLDGGTDAWPKNDYLNIWVCNLPSGTTGYSTLPGGNPAFDGVVINYTAFGTSGTASPPRHMGRTATHYVGRWLNLLNIWGSENPNEASCEDSDLIADTPNQERANSNCPTFPHLSCSNSPNGDLFMNFMDNVDDNCMYMFTKDQCTRMRALFSPSGAREQLKNSFACTPVNTPASPVISLASDYVCGTTSPLNFTINTNNSSRIASYNLEVLGASVLNEKNDGVKVSGQLAPNGCAGMIQIAFSYTDNCGRSFSNVVQQFPKLNVSTIAGSPQLCTQAPAAYSASVENASSNCISLLWSSPNPNLVIDQQITSGNTTTATVHALQSGTYTLSLTVNGCSQTPVVKTFSIQVCSGAPSLPGVPPVDLQFICTDGPEKCYDFRNFCVSSLEAFSPDFKLFPTTNGSRLCLTSIFERRRNSTLFVTPSNACGTGPTVAWTIQIDNPTVCSENPFAGGITDRSAQPELPTAADVNMYYREGVLWVDAFQVAPGTPAQVRVFNANGRLLMSESIEPTRPNQLQLGKQPAGIYLVNILANKEQTTRKVVIAGIEPRTAPGFNGNRGFLAGQSIKIAPGGAEFDSDIHQ